jgi:hypothetical protein
MLYYLKGVYWSCEEIIIEEVNVLKV